MQSSGPEGQEWDVTTRRGPTRREVIGKGKYRRPIRGHAGPQRDCQREYEWLRCSPIGVIEEGISTAEVKLIGREALSVNPPCQRLASTPTSPSAVAGLCIQMTKSTAVLVEVTTCPVIAWGPQAVRDQSTALIHRALRAIEGKHCRGRLETCVSSAGQVLDANQHVQSSNDHEVKAKKILVGTFRNKTKRATLLTKRFLIRLYAPEIENLDG